jgi:hypothetical protein
MKEVRMDFRRTQAIVGLGFKFDGWDVLCGGALACFIVGGLEGSTRPLVIYIGIGLIALWVISVIMVNLGILDRKRPESKPGGETASKKKTG